MPDALMYSEDYYVVLESGQAEQILSVTELQAKLQTVLNTRQDNLPRDLQRFSDVTEQVQYLINTSCELDMGPGDFLQWYAVRLEK